MDRFVVGTGRCGSTMLSRMLAESPQILSVFEFMNGLDMTRRFAKEPVSGIEFAKLVSREHPFVTMVLRRGYPVPEIVYPFDRPGARYRRQDPLPYLLGCALPRMTHDPDALFDETLAFAETRPLQPLARHYRDLFEWWTRRSGRELWIERSGSSIDYLAALSELFPEARFLHLHRDGREAALSMREHHAFRLAIGLSFQVLDDRVHSLDELDLDPGRAPDAGDTISRMLEARPDASWFGRFWNGQIERGLAARRGLGDERYLELRFEDLVARPVDSLDRIAAFFDLDPERDGWTRRAAALVRGRPPLRRPSLPADERRRLDEACREGMRLLGRGPSEESP